MKVVGIARNRNNGPTRSARLLLALGLVIVAASGATGAGNPVSEWKPGCALYGHPVSLTFFFCNTSYFNGSFNGAANQPFFGGIGAYPNIAIYDSSSEGFHLWGPHGDYLSEFEEVGPSEVRGSGAPDDPFEHRGVFAVGDPRQLLIRSYTEYVNGRATFESRWEIENVGAAPMNFRFTVLADVGIHGQCAYGDLESSPRAVGSFTPEEGVPHGTTDCSHVDRERGFSGYAVEKPASPWSAFQQGDDDDIRGRVGDAAGPGLNNTFRAEPGPEVLAIQWDDYGQGRTALAAGETASFELGWRFSSHLLATPFRAESPDSVHRVSLTTRFARGGPITGQPIAYEIARDLGNVGYTRGVVKTDSRGVAQIVWREKNSGYDNLTLSFDANGDGRIQAESELFRMGMWVYWGRKSDRFRTRLSFEASDAGFVGRVRAIYETDPDFGRDCRSFRTIAIRQRTDGRDPTLGSAATNRRGFYDLIVPHGPGDYYAVALPETRNRGTVGAGYRCLGARAD